MLLKVREAGLLVLVEIAPTVEVAPTVPVNSKAPVVLTVNPSGPSKVLLKVTPWPPPVLRVKLLLRLTGLMNEIAASEVIVTFALPAIFTMGVTPEVVLGTSVNNPLVILALIFKAPSCARLSVAPETMVIAPFRVISPGAPASTKVVLRLVAARSSPRIVV